MTVQPERTAWTVFSVLLILVCFYTLLERCIEEFSLGLFHAKVFIVSLHFQNMSDAVRCHMNTGAASVLIIAHVHAGQ